MIEINPITPSYPIKKPKKIIREREQHSEHKQSAADEKEVDQEPSNEPAEQHIDEIV
ncbi:MAG: hypothetical protein ACKE51_05155 [Methylococcaceae bacterium]